MPIPASTRTMTTTTTTPPITAMLADPSVAVGGDHPMTRVPPNTDSTLPNAPGPLQGPKTCAEFLYLWWFIMVFIPISQMGNERPPRGIQWALSGVWDSFHEGGFEVGLPVPTPMPVPPTTTPLGPLPPSPQFSPFPRLSTHTGLPQNQADQEGGFPSLLTHFLLSGCPSCTTPGPWPSSHPGA